MSKNSPLSRSPLSLRTRSKKSRNKPSPTKTRILEGGLDSETSSPISSPAPFLSRNLKDLEEFSSLDDSINSDCEINDGIQTQSFYGGNSSDIFDLIASKKVGNKLKAEIDAKLQVLKKENKPRRRRRNTGRRNFTNKKTHNKKNIPKTPEMKPEPVIVPLNSSVLTTPKSSTKRKFFSHRSPSRKLRSTLTIGNKKVEFEAVKKKVKAKIDETLISNSSFEKECDMFTSPILNALETNEKDGNSIDTIQSVTEELQDENIFEEPKLVSEFETRVENAEIEDKTQSNNTPKTENSKPLYPLFLRQRNKSDSHLSPNVTKKPKNTRTKRFKSSNDGMEQLVIDVGQKEVAPVQCPVCAMIYTPCDANDGAMHDAHHNIRLKRLAFSNWKSERIVRDFNDGRILLILPTDPHFMLQKLNEVWEELNVELGEVAMKKSSDLKFYIFVSNEKKIVGFLAAEPISEAFRLIRDESGSIGSCEQVATSAICGVYRLWTLATYRKQHVATRMLDSLRNSFVYGYVMSITDVAFSSPTLDGAKFLTKYTGTESFLVYK